MALSPRSIGLVLAGLVSASAGGCGHVPLSSLPDLARVEFATTDFARLRAAVALPGPLRAVPEGTKMRVDVKVDGETTSVLFVLREVVDAAERAELARLGQRVAAFRIDPMDLPRLEAIRTEALAHKTAGKRGALTLSILPGACRTAPLDGGPLPVSTWLATAETGSFVPLTRNADLRALLGEEAADAIPICPAKI